MQRYEKLCEMLQCNTALGITAKALLDLYAAEFADDIESHHAMVLRSIDLSGQFRIADRDGDGRLNAVSIGCLSTARVTTAESELALFLRPKRKLSVN